MFHIKKNKGVVSLFLGLTALLISASWGTSTVLAEGKIKPPRWIKLCNKAPIKTAKDAKPENKEICLTHFERLNEYTGLVLISIAIRKIEGQKKDHFVVIIPPGFVIPPGIQVTIDKGKPVKVPYFSCIPSGCTAEIAVTPELMGQMKKGKEMIVAAINPERKVIGFKVPLKGFVPALGGKPMDNKAYYQERKALLVEIRKRRIALQKKIQEQRAKKQKK